MNRKDKDMYLPGWVLGLGIFFFIAAIACVVLAFTSSAYSLIGFAICAVIGIAAVLCWKNQWVKIDDNHSFVYSTMFGNQKRYHFSEIKELKENQDSFTLVCESGKVHIEHCAIMSEKFCDMLDKYIKE